MKKTPFLSYFSTKNTLKKRPYFQKKIFRLLLRDSRRSCYTSDSLALNDSAGKTIHLKGLLHPLISVFSIAFLPLFAALPPRGSGEGTLPIPLLIFPIALSVENIPLLVLPMSLLIFPMSLLVFAKIGCREK